MENIFWGPNLNDKIMNGNFSHQHSSNFLFGAMDRRKNDVPTDIFSQGHKKPLSRGRKKPLKIFSQGREMPANNKLFRWSRQATKQVFAKGKGFLIYKVKATDDELENKQANQSE